MILAHQASVADHQAQIHDAYCLRVLKQAGARSMSSSSGSWFEAASRWEGGYSFAGYLDYMVQELVELHTPQGRRLPVACPRRSLSLSHARASCESTSTGKCVSCQPWSPASRRVIATPGAGAQGEDLPR